MLCVALKASGDCTCASLYRCGVKSLCVMGCALASEPARVEHPIRFGEGYEVDLRPRRLRRGSHRLKLERIPFDILLLLLEHRDEIVTRDQIVSRVWGQGVFLDTDNSIRGAIRKLRQALKDDAECPRFIQTVTGQGYRFIAPVAPPELESRAETPLPEASTVPTSEQNVVPEPNGWLQTPGLRSVGEQQDRTVAKLPAAENGQGHRNWLAHKWLLRGAVSLLVLIAVTVYILARNRSAQTTAPKITSLAVLPLKNLSGDPAQEYFADGMTEEVIGRLSMIRGLRVISRTSVMQFKDTGLLSPEIARRLGVDALVEGSVIREGDRIRVHAQLIRASTDEHFWSETYDRKLGDALTLESEVAQSIAQRVEVTVSGEERARLVAARPVSPEAYESYLQGMFAQGNRRAEVEKRIAWFDEAISKDPAFAQAYVGLASAYEALGTVFVGAPPSETRPKVINAARKALELDPDLADAHVMLANMYTRQWKWAEAEAEYRRALDLNPNDAAAHDGFSDWLLCHGRMEEALAWARRARDLDPLGASGHTIAWTLFNAHRYDEAIREFRDVLAVRPDDRFPLWPLGWALICNHQAEEAIPELEKAVSATDSSPGVISALIWAYAHAGRRADALRLLGELKKRRQTGYVPAGAFVNAYLGLGENDEAFAWFERAYEEQSNILIYIKVSPLFDPLRGDPRFQDLVRRVGLN
jgi:TolB-like protein/DNA-binding winged helix-turn-helix (wHTH) protein/Flp pilus assembly protein TadD